MTSYLSDIISNNSLDFLGIRETMKRKFSLAFLRKIDPGGVFTWDWIDSNGKSGGILCGIKTDSYTIRSVKKGRYILQFDLFLTTMNMDISVLVVYGFAHEEHKIDFLSELASFCHAITVPYVVGGDFNVLRHCEEKNKNTPLAHSSDVFNAIINTLSLREIFMSGGSFTWSNNQAIPTLEKLDRILISPSWEDLFPLVHVKKLIREMSDHNPLIMDYGIDQKLPPTKRSFRFDIAWLKNEDFLPLVREIWDNHVNSTDPIDVLNIKLKRIKRYFKGWGSNLFGHNKKRKQELQMDL